MVGASLSQYVHLQRRSSPPPLQLISSRQAAHESRVIPPDVVARLARASAARRLARSLFGWAMQTSSELAGRVLLGDGTLPAETGAGTCSDSSAVHTSEDESDDVSSVMSHSALGLLWLPL